MSGPQFVHLQSYSRKANAAGQSVDQVLGEAAREAQYSKHVTDVKPPVVVFGADIDELRKRHDDMVASGGVEVTLKDGRKARRGIRKDRHTLMTAVASHPYPMELVENDADARAEYERWKVHNVEWLKERFGSNLVSIIEHLDENHPHIHAYILPLDDPTCTARNLNPAWVAKEKAEIEARERGATDREAVKFGNVAYRQAARDLQDDYYQNVSLPGGLTRTGPKRERLSRKQWREKKAAARREAKMMRDMEVRLDQLVDAEDDLEKSLAAKTEHIAEKLDLAEQALEEADEARSVAERTRQRAIEEAEKIRIQAREEIVKQRQSVEQQARLQLEQMKRDLAQAKEDAEREAQRLKTRQNALANDRNRELSNAARASGETMIELFKGVLDGSVYPDTDKKSVWVIEDNNLRDRTEKMGLVNVVHEFLSQLYEAWIALKTLLSSAERKYAKDQLANKLDTPASPSQGFQP